ncbi:MAG: MFS transporter [Alphaproteobacteria bacterium]|nr:MAG: MFS transporter [Alphaproteobacteria bacterium]
MTAPASRRAVFAWCLYDWGNSAFPTVIATFLFSAYFTTAVAPTDAIGTALWGQATALVGIAVALASPVLGAIADQGGRRKPWIGVLSAVSIVATALMWFVTPDPSAILLALMLYGIASFGFELALVFYNAMLPDLAPDDRLGRVSGWGWGLGYFGGLACLALSLALVQPDPAPFGLDRSQAEHARAVAFVVAFWYALFALPLFFLTPDRPRGGLPMATAIRSGLATLAGTLKRLPRHRNVLRFLIAKMLYIDGLNTLFAFGGIYAAGTIGMSLEEVLLFGVIINISSGLGAFLFAWVDDWIGAKPTIVIALLALILFGSAILFVEDKTWFYVLAMGIGAFLGPTQAASRSMMARLAPRELMTEFFGLYALAGRATAFLGPFLLGWVTLMTDSQRAGMATILPFFAVGLLLLLGVRETRRALP